MPVLIFLLQICFPTHTTRESTGEDTAEQKWAEMKENLAEINEVARFVRYH